MRFTGALLLGTFLSSAAWGTDLPPAVYKAQPAVMAPMPYSWTGVYIGLNAGYGWNDGLIDIRGTDPKSIALINAATKVGIPTSLAPKAAGFLGGGQVGFNYQIGPVVVGIETDFDGSTMKGDDNWSGSIGVGRRALTIGETSHEGIDWLGTTRARAGFLVVPSVLVYGTGGVAYGQTTSSFGVTAGNFVASTMTTEILTGWAAGAGVEFAFWPNWSLKAEYLHYDLGNSSWTYRPPINVGAYQLSSRFDGNLARLGVNYRF